MLDGRVRTGVPPTFRTDIISRRSGVLAESVKRCRFVATQRFESSVTAISWIPSEAISGPSKIPFEAGFTHYDEPPPDRLDDLEELRKSDRFREAN